MRGAGLQEILIASPAPGNKTEKSSISKRMLIKATLNLMVSNHYKQNFFSSMNDIKFSSKAITTNIKEDSVEKCIVVLAVICTSV